MFVQQYMFNNMRLTILDQTSLIDMPAKEGGPEGVPGHQSH